MAHPITRRELLDLLRRVAGVKARYREEQHMALLAAPLVSEGTLHFSPPGKLARHQQQPTRASVVIAAGKLSFADEFGGESLDLASNPIVALFADSFVHVLAGDEAALSRSYVMEFSADADHDGRAWTLTLRPKVPAVAHVLEKIVLRGREAVVRELEVFEPGGDRTLTRLLDVDINHRYDDEEAARIFAAPSPPQKKP